ncbi:MAG: hypothetical protein MUC81_10590 [Bacteroidia bacterium]|jgi:hypothetical protein|nr:hypothetical protein [Bacteroidia bacterium]
MQFGFDICPYCGNTSGFVYVHGHYQCKRCCQNVMPCCSGEQAPEQYEPSASEAEE